MSIYLSIILNILSIFILAATSTLYLFRCEIYLLKRKYISGKLFETVPNVLPFNLRPHCTAYFIIITWYNYIIPGIYNCIQNEFFFDRPKR
jgi:hypothetical protein